MILNRKSLSEALEAIRGANSFLIAGHVNPDGDTLGCVLALEWALRALGKDVTSISIDGVPETLQFLPGQERVQITTDKSEFDLAILCDLEGLNRVGRNSDVVLKANRILVIDHHVPWEQFGDMRLIDTDASATTMVVYELLRAMKAAITPEIASSLLTGIITDTGSFKYQNTTPKALQISSHLVDSGADIVKINEEVFENRSMASMKLLGIGLTNLRSIRDGEIIWSTLSLEDFNKAGASDEQSEGIIAHMRSIRGAKMVALLREIKENRVRVSLRAREPYSVSEIAQRFEGGGHRLAAGCSLQASLVESERIILEAIEQWMDSLTSTKTPV